MEQGRRYTELRGELDLRWFSEYFGLSAEEMTLVRETVEILMPSICPRSFKSLDTPASIVLVRNVSPYMPERLRISDFVANKDANSRPLPRDCSSRTIQRVLAPQALCALPIPRNLQTRPK